MLRNKVEVELILTDTGKIRISCGGCSSIVPDTAFGLIANLEVELLASLGLLNKMNIKEGDLITSGGVVGVVTKTNKYDEFITIKTEDDPKEYSISRKYVELIKEKGNGKNL